MTNPTSASTAAIVPNSPVAIKITAVRLLSGFGGVIPTVMMKTSTMLSIVFISHLQLKKYAHPSHFCGRFLLPPVCSCCNCLSFRVRWRPRGSENSEDPSARRHRPARLRHGGRPLRAPPPRPPPHPQRSVTVDRHHPRKTPRRRGRNPRARAPHLLPPPPDQRPRRDGLALPRPHRTAQHRRRQPHLPHPRHTRQPPLARPLPAHPPLHRTLHPPQSSNPPRTKPAPRLRQPLVLPGRSTPPPPHRDGARSNLRLRHRPPLRRPPRPLPLHSPHPQIRPHHHAHPQGRHCKTTPQPRPRVHRRQPAVGDPPRRPRRSRRPEPLPLRPGLPREHGRPPAPVPAPAPHRQRQVSPPHPRPEPRSHRLRHRLRRRQSPLQSLPPTGRHQPEGMATPKLERGGEQVSAVVLRWERRASALRKTIETPDWLY